MNPIISIKDNVFNNIDDIKKEILSTQFVTFVNDKDNIGYPGINSDLSDWVKELFIKEIQDHFKEQIKINLIFSRVMLSNEQAPNTIHSDNIIGQYAAHLYLSRDWPENTGTVFYTHPIWSYIDNSTIQKMPSYLDPEWSSYLLVKGSYNRMLIHKGNYWHMATPHSGWGETPAEGRLVLSCFFDLQTD